MHTLTAMDEATRRAIDGVVADHRTLEDVVRWALSSSPPRLFPRARMTGVGGATVEGGAPGFDLVVQDEYTHDVVVPWDALAAEGGASIYLVYDTT